MTIVSDNSRFMLIFVGFPGEWDIMLHHSSNMIRWESLSRNINIWI